MELGLTIPLQRHLGIKTPPYGQEADRREVAFLNRAWDDVMAAELALDESGQSQLLLDQIVNAKASRCVGFEGLGAAAERLAAALREMS